MAKTTRAQSPPFLGRLKLPPTPRTRPRFTTWTIRNRRPTRERWGVVVNGYGVVSHSSSLPIKKATHSQHPLNPYTPNPNQTLNPNQTYLQTSKIPQHKPTSNPNLKPQPQTPTSNPNLKPQTSNLKPQTSNLKPQTSNLKPQTSNLKPQTPNLKPQTPNLKPQTPNLKPQTPNLKPQPQTPQIQAPNPSTNTTDAISVHFMLHSASQLPPRPRPNTRMTQGTRPPGTPP